MTKPLELLATAVRKQQDRQAAPPHSDTISVSETVSAAASVYESLRNSLEYDEEHLLRRNAIRRILKRRIDEEAADAVAGDLMRELIWARYLPNKTVPEKAIGVVANVLEKYRPLFAAARSLAHDTAAEEWLLDVVSTEVEYALAPPLADEALASFAYQELKKRVVWDGAPVDPQDRDLQLYIAVHRAVLKSNLATLRFRTFTLFYPGWTKASADTLVAEVASGLEHAIASIERQIHHPAADRTFRLVRRYAVVFHLLRDVLEKDPSALEDRADSAIEAAAKIRYARFQARLRRSVFRAVIFLLMTKTILALLIEFPYERLVLQTTDIRPLIANILFHPLLLGFIGLTVSIPVKKNTAKILELSHGILGTGPDFTIPYRATRGLGGAVGFIFNLAYGAFFLFTVGAIVSFLAALHFNPVSIGLFLFFLALVTFFGLKIRNSRRDLVIIETGGGIFGTLIDVLFLPLVRAGRWIALRAPRVNVFLFFFDYIVEAPFKGAIGLVEGWLAFLREKKEEI